MSFLDIRAALLLTILSASGPAAAIPVTVEFRGQVAGPSFIIPPSLIGVLAIGDPVFGRFSYETTTPDSDADATRGLYVHRDPRFRLEVTLGGAQISTDPANPELWIQILDDHPLGISPDGIDRFDVISRHQTLLSPSEIVPAQLHLLLSDLSKTVFSSDALPAIPPDLDRFAPIGQPFAQGQVATLSGESPAIFVNFSVTSWTVVPEPAPALLLGMMLAAAWTLRRRMPRQAQMPPGPHRPAAPVAWRGGRDSNPQLPT